MTNRFESVLFDLDGTLCDTLPDLTFVLNQMRATEGLAPLAPHQVREAVSDGSKALLKVAFDVEATDARFTELRSVFFNLYEMHLARSTALFPGMSRVIDYLNAQHIPWGIVTNKPSKYTHLLLEKIALNPAPQCIVCGDTLTSQKPDPQPVQYACELLNKPSSTCLFIGDSIHDVKASQAAGATALVALYGYIPQATDPHAWQAQGYIDKPEDVLGWV